MSLCGCGSTRVARLATCSGASNDFGKILNCYQVNCKHAVMGIMDEVILMQITAGQKEDLKVTYYIPTLIT